MSSPIKSRLLTALLCFAALAVLAGATLDGVFRTMVWIVLGGLAVKTWIAVLKERSEE